MRRIADRGTVLSFLRVPPFPRARPRSGAVHAPIAPAQAALLADEAIRHRVGGAFWCAQPILPIGHTVAIAPSSKAVAQEMLRALRGTDHAGLALAIAPARWLPRDTIPCFSNTIDPWHLATHVDTLWVDGDDERGLVAALLGKHVRVFGPGRFAALGDAHAVARDTAAACLVAELNRAPLADPFTGAAWDPGEAIAQLGAWRRMIDDNRIPVAIHGVARWKRVTMDALLWDGSEPIRYVGPRRRMRATAGETVLAWTSRVAPAQRDKLAARGVHLGEIEDGMIRSQGLGANCVPPLSVIVDRRGAHFDPSRPSTLETLLAEATFPPELCARAAALRERLLAAGLSKYGVSPPQDQASRVASPGRRRVLVPGQVEDDRSVLLGGGGMTNLALLARARAAEPGAHITYRPHPDVLAGHRRGHIPEAAARAFADRIEPGGAITDAIDAADALHVLTSLAGFEALMRGKAVTTHGVPFYAGWGLTHDTGPVPARRGRVRTIDELVAAVLILYPRYLDPVTRLPCPVELLVERLATGDAAISSPLIAFRTWQGKLNRMISAAKGSVR